MAAITHFLRAILLPLLTATILYLLTTLLLLPFIRRHRSYTAYLPLSTATLPSTTTWRTTLSDALYALFAPSTWLRRPVHMPDDEDASDFDDEEGEGMVGFEPVDQRRREALERGRGTEERRVGRELEQGFRDESDEEGGDETRREISRARTQVD